MTKLVITSTCLLLLLITLIAPTAFAQIPEGIRPVVKGALVTTIFNSSEIKDADAGFGYSFGAGAIIPLGNPAFSIQPEVNYVDKRAWVRVQEGDSPGLTLAQYELQFSYLDIPVVANWYFSRAPELRIYLQGGAMASLRLSSKLEDEVNGEIVKKDIEGLNDLTWGIPIGIGLQAGRITVEMRYDIGLTKVGNVEDAGDPRIDTLNFLFGFVF